MIENNLTYTFAEVVFPLPVNHPFTYKIPENLLEDIVPGMRVLAPFGPRKTTGFVVSRKEKADYPQIKELEEVLDPIPLFTPQVLKLTQWIADYYMCGWGEVLKAALPAGIHLNSEKVIRLVHPDPDQLIRYLKSKAPIQADIIRVLQLTNPITTNNLLKKLNKNSIASSLKNLRSMDYIRFELALPNPKVNKKYETYVKLAQHQSHEKIAEIADSIRDKAPKQAECLDTMLAFPGKNFTRSDLSKQAKAGSSIIKSLVDRGVLALIKEEVYRDYYSSQHIEPPPDITLNPDQETCLKTIKDKIDAKEFSSFLLYGVTGSGKTQVYIEAIQHVLSKNQTAIVLVPEIALTPQMVSRFRSHFGDKVAVFHSRMSPGERYDSWRRTWEGRHQIVIGPRSAIFAPLKNIGLLIVDEEHESSYKQTDTAPRYNARDVSIVRANLNNAVVVLGSATPSVESFFNAQINKFNQIDLPKRIDDIPLPKVTIVDMKKEPKIIGRKEPILLSRVLRQKIDEKLSLGEQIILFQNRRGFAALLKCQECGYVATCENCDISLTYHLRGHTLKCHYCDYTKPAPDFCPECRSTDIYFRGAGTQRIEEEVKTLFPGVKMIRMDLDTTKGKRAHDRILSQFARGEYQILLGTQMVAKGLDFPNVTLVGVISADTQLLFPDFRAGERTFQLLTQVAGRAGRKEKQGEVYIQTYSPDHYSIIFAKTHDYLNFFKTELTDRQEHGYPPFSRALTCLCKGPDEEAVQKVAIQIVKNIKPGKEFRILGPAPAPLAKIQGNYRWQILFMSLKHSDAGGKAMKNALSEALITLKGKNRIKTVQVSIDVDPVTIL